MKRLFLRIITVISLLFIATPLPVSASTNDFYFEDATFDYYLDKSSSGSTMKVTEKFTAVFPDFDQNHGIERMIPFTNQAGANRTIDNLVLTVTRNGEPEPYKITEEDDYYLVRIGDASTYVQGTQEYILNYEYKNVITEFDGFQELYWDTNGTGWWQPFNSLTATIHLSDDLKSSLKPDAWCYVGSYGSSDQTRCNISETKDGFSFTTSGLDERENLTFAVQFNEGTFVVPINYNFVPAIFGGIFLALAIIGIIIGLKFYTHASSKRKYYKGLFTPPQYQPYSSLSVAELGKICIKPTKSPLVATILELAVNNHIELVRGKKKLLSSKYNWSLKVKDTDINRTENAALCLISGLPTVKAGDTISLHSRVSDDASSLRNAFDRASTIKLLDTGLYEPKDSVAYKSFGRSLAFFILYTILCSVVFMVYISATEASRGTAVGETFFKVASVFSFLTALILLIISLNCRKYAQRTEKGLEASRYAEGLKEYIKLAEKDRIKFLQSVQGADTSPKGLVKLYEKLLPYAALFGLEDSWLEQLDYYYQDLGESYNPIWYSGGIISASDLRSAVSAVSSASHVYSPSDSSSSSGSGGGGGGFSGGGGGGGGGGGW